MTIRMLVKPLSVTGNKDKERLAHAEKELLLPKRVDVAPTPATKKDASPKEDASGLKELEIMEPVLRPPLLLKLNQIAKP